MSIMKRFLLAAGLLALTGGAHAADLPVKAPPIVAPAPSWTGWYIGVNGGGAWGTVNPSAADFGPPA